MRRKLLLLAALTVAFFFAAGSLYSVRDGPEQRIPTTLNEQKQQQKQQQLHHGEDHEPQTQDVGGSAKATSHPSDGQVLSASNITTYLDAIFRRKETSLPNLTCPTPDKARYETLKAALGRRRAPRPPVPAVRYFFAVDLRQNLPLLPRLIGSVVEVARFLGPEACALSIVEGNSDDGTGDVLAALEPELARLGVAYFYRASAIDPSRGDRIRKLAELRNLALEPLVSGRVRAVSGNTKDDRKDDRKDDDDDTTVVFLNDVAICPDDILELLLQKRALAADMTCAMDWTYVGRDPTFYDVWVARGITGDSFFEIPPDGNWNSAWNLFWNDAASQARLAARRPFQVFACWNGAAAFTARPLLERDPRRRVAFRAPDRERGECDQGEPQLFCKDLWHRGYGRIAVVPAVNLEYSVDRARDIKELKGYTAENVRGGDSGEDQGGAGRFTWQREPPGEVKCMPVWENQFWRPWNEGLS
ncbi:hypothetical protein ESCO_004853 [Escovopsis weberi]|uniref:Alpha-1 n=1 Tax=Escovopsis weberi TaxID=150374 RepID=A0A0M8MZY2_ESCWE|nr:hypothetical protein ESCO_004853 [Escovopsis weberi]